MIPNEFSDDCACHNPELEMTISGRKITHTKESCSSDGGKECALGCSSSICRHTGLASPEFWKNRLNGEYTWRDNERDMFHEKFMQDIHHVIHLVINGRLDKGKLEKMFTDYLISRIEIGRKKAHHEGSVEACIICVDQTVPIAIREERERIIKIVEVMKFSDRKIDEKEEEFKGRIFALSDIISKLQ